ncbi:MAG: enoyl-CoA hydratase [Candidatus Eremiobacteraeota bacterium]|nr:enoyl-CoA hydratase [Candidatus Eremiobacteraeota bacterium]
MDIQSTVEDGIQTITFNRPAKKNAITAAMYQLLADALRAGEADASVRVILICGLPEIFTAGNDLEDFMNAPPHDDNSPVFQFLSAISTAQKPLVAAVRGAAVGVGTTLLLHCDLVYAGRSARFSLPFVQLGICPEAASSLLLPQMIGYRHAAAKLLLGEAFGADEALAMGFVNQVLDDDAVLSHARAQAVKLAALPASAIRTTKRLMKGDAAGDVATRMQKEGVAFRAMLSSLEAREAFTAFFEKRKPDFKQFA